MDQIGQLIGQNFLSLVELAALPLIHFVNLLQRQESQHSDTLEYVRVAYVPPILVEIIGRSLVGVQPNRAGGGLAHFLALRVHEQGDGHGIGVLAQLAADQLRTAQHIAPLVVTAELHVAPHGLKHVVEVIGLHDHIVKFQEAQALFHPLLIAFSPQHVVYRETGTHFPKKVHVVEL